MTLTVKQAARRLNVSPSLVYAMCAAGRLPHHRVGVGRGTIRIDEADLDAVKTVPAPRPDALAAAGLKHLALGG